MYRKFFMYSFVFLCFELHSGNGASTMGGREFDETAMKDALSKQKYGEVLKYLYKSNINKNKAVIFAREAADKGHVPLMYYLVREYALSNFGNYNQLIVREALKWALISGVLTYMDMACCTKIGQKFPAQDVLEEKYFEKFSKCTITPEDFSFALDKAKWWLKSKDTSAPLSPTWILLCSRGGMGEPALKFCDSKNGEGELFLQDKEAIKRARKKGYDQTIKKYGEILSRLRE